MTEQHVWRYPGDREPLVDKLARALRAYRRLAEAVAPSETAQLDALVRRDPELAYRIGEDNPIDKDEFLSAADVACLVGVDANTPRVWAARGLIEKYTAEDGSPRYLVSEVVELMKKRRQRRAQAG